MIQHRWRQAISTTGLHSLEVAHVSIRKQERAESVMQKTAKEKKRKAGHERTTCVEDLVRNFRDTTVRVHTKKKQTPYMRATNF